MLTRLLHYNSVFLPISVEELLWLGSNATYFLDDFRNKHSLLRQPLEKKNRDA